MSKMPVWSWIVKFLSMLGLRKKASKLIFLGLDNAGKSTMLHMLMHHRMAQPSPTHFPTKNEFSIGNMVFTIFDFGGHKEHRILWKDYLAIPDAIVFFIDAADPKRFPESKDELYSLLETEDLEHCPILILGNKADRPRAVCEEELRSYFELQTTTGKTNIPRSLLSSRPLELFMCSVLHRQGYEEGFRWLAQYLNCQ